MNTTTILRKIVQVILGELELITRMPPFLDRASGFVAVESSRRGYRIENTGNTIIVRRVDPWAIVAGLPPLYYFKGKLTKDASGVAIEGRILMSSLPKYFIISWMSAVVVAFIATLLWAMVLATRFMATPSTPVREDLTTAGFLIGGIVGLGVFGVLVIFLVRAISQRQKRKLIIFCEGMHQRPESQVNTL